MGGGGRERKDESFLLLAELGEGEGLISICVGYGQEGREGREGRCVFVCS